MAIEREEAYRRAFEVPALSYDEFRNQELVETNDGEFFDSLDEAYGIVPRTDELMEDAEE